MSIKRANIKLFDKLSEKMKIFFKSQFLLWVYLSSYNYRELELFNPELSTRLSQVRSFGFINHWNNKIVPFSLAFGEEESWPNSTLVHSENIS